MDFLFLFSFSVVHGSSSKSLLIMCGNENEQKQWISKLKRKIPRPQGSQDTLTR